MDTIKAIILGIVEGITEWLPISSTGHMIILKQFMHYEMTDEFMQMFLVVIQLGAILAVIIIYFSKLWPFTKKRNTHYLNYPVINLWFKIIIACVPAAIIGFSIDDWLNEYMYNSWVTAAMLIVYGVIFIIVDKGKRPIKKEISELNFKDAFIIGLWQVLALIPGTSRSGATILGGLILGASRTLSTEFTFLLAVPVIFGASGLKLAKYFLHGMVFNNIEIMFLVTGIITAFIVSIFSVKFLINYVKNHSFKVFGWYRICLGILVLTVSMFQIFNK